MKEPEKNKQEYTKNKPILKKRKLIYSEVTMVAWRQRRQ